eukprot:852748-Pyramimonas_sp.AAC.1
MSLDCAAKISLSREILLDVIVLPRLTDEGKVKTLQLFGEALAVAFTRDESHPSNVQEFSLQCQGLGMLLNHLPNEDPVSFVECKPHLKVMIELLTGTTEDAEWHPLAE